MKTIFFVRRNMLFLLVIFQACGQSLPAERYTYFEFKPSYKLVDDSIALHISNPLACPLRVKIKPATILKIDSNLTKRFIPLAPYDSVTLKYALPLNFSLPDTPFHYEAIIGNPQALRLDTNYRYAFPFPEGKRVPVIQGYFGNFSHQGIMRNYALDLRMDIGDTVCAARAGIVVAKIEGYDVHGAGEEYKSFANCLFIYHEDGSIAQYVHLKQKGCLVNLGDTITKGQPIALSGMTGYTTVPHLHFNVVVPTEDGAKSIPVKFEKIAGSDIKKGMVLYH
jgi:murein DD-endopeptidase MepM/ murein hydrolase activator NlpD